MIAFPAPEYTLKYSPSNTSNFGKYAKLQFFVAVVNGGK